MSARFHQNKCSKFLIISLSKFCCKKRHEAIIKKERRKKKKDENKVAHVLTKIYISREICFKEHNKFYLSIIYVHYISTHMHLSTSMTLLSLDPGFGFIIYAR